MSITRASRERKKEGRRLEPAAAGQAATTRPAGACWVGESSVGHDTVTKRIRVATVLPPEG